MELTRRQMVIGTTSIVLAGGFQFLTPTSSRAATVEWSLEVLEEQSIPVFGTDFRSESVLVVPAVFGLTPATQRQAFAELRFDSRVFQLTDYAWTIRGSGTPARARVSGLKDWGNGTSSALVELGEVKVDGVRVHLPLRAVDRYPNENLGAISNLTVTLGDSPTLDGAESFTWAPTAPTPIAAWGASLAAGWGSVEIESASERLNYRYPVRIKCTSVGPEPIPAGSTITISADDRVVGAFAIQDAVIAGETIIGAGLTSAPARTGGRSLLQLTLTSPVAAGEVVDFTLLPETIDPAPKLADVTFAKVNFEAPASMDGSRLRDTSRLSLAPVTSSGTPAAPNAAVGRI